MSLLLNDQPGDANNLPAFGPDEDEADADDLDRHEMMPFDDVLPGDGSDDEELDWFYEADSWSDVDDEDADQVAVGTL